MSLNAGIVVQATVRNGTTLIQGLGGNVALAEGIFGYVGLRRSVPAGTSGLVIDLPGMTTPNMVLLTSDQPISIQVDPDAEPVFTNATMLCVSGSFAALILSNPGTAAANVEILVAGA